MPNDHSRRRVHVMGGWPIVALLVVVIAAALYFTLGRQDRAAKLRVGSGTAQAMFDGTHTGQASEATVKR